MKRICGLRNVGNTCYINASLQILSQIDELNYYLILMKKMKNIPDTILVFEWIGLYKMIHDNQGYIIPYRFIENLKKISIKKNRDEFSTNEQNDSVDLFDFILECIHNSLNHLDKTLHFNKTGCKQVDQYLKKIEESDCSIIPALFLTCTLNQYIHPINKKIEFYKLEHEYKIGLSIPNKHNISLNDCFVETFKEESLTGDNAWFDEKENKKKSVLKRSALTCLPIILCLHLKRWRDNLTKKSDKVESPFILDITKFTIYKERTLYQLFGIVNHEGSINGGHYYSYVLRDKTWFSLNDEIVKSISLDSVIHESNYCLFYRKIK
jgi:ubiquitin C-terminal hydrolase